MSTTIVEGFSLSHAAILNGQTGAEQAPLYGIRSGSLALDTSSYDNTGDDSVLSTWYWFTKATLTVQSGYVPFETVALLSNSKITSSGAGTSDYYTLPLWELRTQNTPAFPVLVRVPSKDSLGALRTLDFVLYRVQFQPFSFDGPTYKTGLLLNYTGSALPSPVDEQGGAVLDSVTGAPSKSIGRIVSRPQV